MKKAVRCNPVLTLFLFIIPCVSFLGLYILNYEPPVPQETDTYVPSALTSTKLERALTQPAQLITSIMFEQHGDWDNITLQEYDSRNYCATIYTDSTEEPLHLFVSDITVVRDDTLSDSYVIPVGTDRCVLKLSEDIFVSQLSKELFTNMTDEQIDFVLGFLFRHV